MKYYAANSILMIAKSSWEECICSEMRDVHVVKKGVRLVIPYFNAILSKFSTFMSIQEN